MNWYYIDRGQKAGPLADAQLDAMVRAGQLTPDSLVWREGMTEWQPYGRVRSACAPVVSGRGTGQMMCSLCSRSFPPDDLIAFEDAWVCAACKPQLVQRVREGLTVGLASGNAWRDGDLVVTRAGSTLIGRCIKCNGVESLSHTPSSLQWHPRWVYALLLLTPVAYMLGALATQKYTWVGVSVCCHHRNQRSKLTAASWLILLIALVLGAAAAGLSSIVLLVIAGSVLAVGAMAFRQQWNVLSVAKNEGEYLWLRGCGRAFVDALAEFSAQRAMERQEGNDPPIHLNR